MDNEEIRMTNKMHEILDEELQYQNIMAGTRRADTVDYGIAGQILAMKRMLQKAEERFVDEPGVEGALEEIMKCTGAGTRACIRYDCPRRGKLNVDYHPPKSIWQ